MGDPELCFRGFTEYFFAYVSLALVPQRAPLFVTHTPQFRKIWLHHARYRYPPVGTPGLDALWHVGGGVAKWSDGCGVARVVQVSVLNSSLWSNG